MPKNFLIIFSLFAGLFLNTVSVCAETAEDYFKRGFKSYEQGNLEASIADFTKAVEKNPDFAAAYNNRGLVYAKQRNFIQAIADYTKCVQINPRFAAAYNNRGLAYHNRGTIYGNQENFKQAIADYTQAIKIDPNYAQAYYNRAFSYFMSKDYDLAWTDVERSESLGMLINPEFLEQLKTVSGKQR